MTERVVYSREAVIERQETSDSGYRATIFVNERARQGPDLVLDGLGVGNYMRNPVVLWAHDMKGQTESGGLPIGRTNRMHNDGNRLEVDFEFLADDPFAARVNNAWDKGFLKAASVSWLPLESEEAEAGQQRDIRSDLLEWSLVSVPSDPDAVRNAHSRIMDALVRQEEEEEPDAQEEEEAEEVTPAPCWEGDGPCSLRGVLADALPVSTIEETEPEPSEPIDEDGDRLVEQTLDWLLATQAIKQELRGTTT